LRIAASGKATALDQNAAPGSAAAIDPSRFSGSTIRQYLTVHEHVEGCLDMNQSSPEGTLVEESVWIPASATAA
jgi:hypothetical protein